MRDLTYALVTGGAGFLGTHLCQRLLAGGCQVVCVDDLSSSAPRNLADLRANERFEFVEHDITEADGVERGRADPRPSRQQFADPLCRWRTG